MATNAAVRGLLAIVAGVVLSGLVIGGIEMAAHAAFPLPPDTDMNNPDHLGRLWDWIPTETKALVLVAWFLGPLAGACTAIAIARRVLPAWIVGVAVAGLGLWTTQMFPHPDWMLASAVVLPLVAVLIAKRLMLRRLATV